MANYQNHVVDPTWFYDALELFSFTYDCYIVTNKKVDEYGDTKYVYEQYEIPGSLQSQGTTVNFTMTGNTENMEYKFYCKSLYRINIGDFILYKNRLLNVYSVNDYDEYGVRECSLKLVELSNYRDLQEYIKYINGETIV